MDKCVGVSGWERESDWNEFEVEPVSSHGNTWWALRRGKERRRVILRLGPLRFSFCKTYAPCMQVRHCKRASGGGANFAAPCLTHTHTHTHTFRPHRPRCVRANTLVIPTPNFACKLGHVKLRMQCPPVFRSMVREEKSKVLKL